MQQLFDLKKINHNEVAQALLRGVQYVYGGDVQGDIVEFGTNTGRTAKIIAQGLASCLNGKSTAKYNSEKYQKNFHLFDSFRGMPRPTHEADLSSPKILDGSWSQGRLKGVDAQGLMAMVSQFVGVEHTMIYEGFFSETLPEIQDGTRFAMIHMDATIYASTFEVLDHLFHNGHVSEGAIIFFRGWNANRAKNDAGERRAWLEAQSKFNILASPHTYYAWQGGYTFVHSYTGMPSSDY